MSFCESKLKNLALARLVEAAEDLERDTVKVQLGVSFPAPLTGDEQIDPAVIMANSEAVGRMFDRLKAMNPEADDEFFFRAGYAAAMVAHCQ